MNRIDDIRRQLPSRDRRLLPGGATLRAAAADAKGPTIAMRIPFGKRSVDLYGFTEIIDPGAFTKTLQERGGDVVALWNHDSAFVLGRQSNSTFSVRADADALLGDVQLDGADPMHQHFARRVERRDVIGSSFGFETVRDMWVDEADGTVTRTLLEVRLFEMSPVTFPAYPDSDAETRMLREGRLAELAAVCGIDALELNSIVAASRASGMAPGQAEALRGMIQRLQKLLPAPAAPTAHPEARARRLDQLARQHGLVPAA